VCVAYEYHCCSVARNRVPPYLMAETAQDMTDCDCVRAQPSSVIRDTWLVSIYAPVHANAAARCVCSKIWEVKAGQLSYSIHPYSSSGLMNVQKAGDAAPND
jgi:hypothetical protein